MRDWGCAAAAVAGRDARHRTWPEFATRIPKHEVYEQEHLIAGPLLAAGPCIAGGGIPAAERASPP